MPRKGNHRRWLPVSIFIFLDFKLFYLLLELFDLLWSALHPSSYVVVNCK